VFVLYPLDTSITNIIIFGPKGDMTESHGEREIYREVSDRCKRLDKNTIYRY
jgi:hypothetical protein